MAKVFYIAADGTVAGPVPHARLTFMLASGEIGLGTQVVPEGSEQWAPLPHQLKWHVRDGNGKTCGPLSFQHLAEAAKQGSVSRNAAAVESDGSEWRPLVQVLTAGGIVLDPPVTAGGRFSSSPQLPLRTSPASRSLPASSPRAGTDTAGRVRPLEGIDRGIYAVWIIGIAFGIVAFGMALGGLDLYTFSAGFAASVEGINLLFNIYLRLGLIALLVVSCLRLQNTGMTRMFSAPMALATGLSLLPALSVSWLPKFQLILLGCSAFLAIALIVIPPDFARTRRFDWQSLINFVLVIVSLAWLCIKAILSLLSLIGIEL